MARLDPPLTAKNGHKLEVLAICRISTIHQDKRSLADQEASYREWLAQHTDLPVEMHVVSSQGSGECLDRSELLDATEKVASGRFDLVITEDLGRICRRMQAHIFCESCVDVDTRLVAINDHIDTAQDGWEMNSVFAVMRHETYNRDTSLRIRRSLRNRFTQGGVLRCPIFGYVVPEGAKTDAEMRRDPNAEPIYDKWFRMLEEGATYAEVADYLNANNVPTGPSCRLPRWTGPMVSRVTHNPLIKGLRVRNKKISKRINKTGRRKSVNAPPEERLERHCPDLAFIAPDRYDRVIRLLDKRNAKYRRHLTNGRDPRANVSKKRTRWPGQHIYCGVCGRPFVYGGHGQRDRLVCSGAKNYQCWNGVTVDGPLARERLSASIYQALRQIPSFDAKLMSALEKECTSASEECLRKTKAMRQRIDTISRQIDNVIAAIRTIGHSDRLCNELTSLEHEQRELLDQLRETELAAESRVQLPTPEQVRKLAEKEFGRLSVESDEFARLMRRLISQIYVFPVQLIGGSATRLCASFTVCGSELLGSAAALPPAVKQQLESRICIRLFDPPQREQYREDVVRMRASGMREQEVADRLGITKTAAQSAAALQRTMDANGITDPWQPVTEPPSNDRRMKRHRHKRYKFEPLEGFPLPWPNTST